MCYLDCSLCRRNKYGWFEVRNWEKYEGVKWYDFIRRVIVDWFELWFEMIDGWGLVLIVWLFFL